MNFAQIHTNPYKYILIHLIDRCMPNPHTYVHTHMCTETDGQTGRQTEIDRQAGRQTGRHTNTDTDRNRGKPRQTEAGRDGQRQAGRQAGRKTDRDRHTDKQTDRQTDKQTNTLAYLLVGLPAYFLTCTLTPVSAYLLTYLLACSCFIISSLSDSLAYLLIQLQSIVYITLHSDIVLLCHSML